MRLGNMRPVAEIIVEPRPRLEDRGVLAARKPTHRHRDRAGEGGGRAGRGYETIVVVQRKAEVLTAGPSLHTGSVDRIGVRTALRNRQRLVKRGQRGDLVAGVGARYRA